LPIPNITKILRSLTISWAMSWLTLITSRHDYRESHATHPDKILERDMRPRKRE
jgi:hypothetical protein